MDPLSVTASVVGIISASVKLIPQLYEISSTIKDAPRLAQAAAAELHEITLILQQLQKYIDGYAQASPTRLSLITVEHITASLTGCVLTYSELDAALKSMHTDTGMKAWDRAKWYVKRDEINAIVGRLQGHKASFSLMLNIIQCSSMGEAERSMEDLCDKISILLSSNRRLSMRLRNIEDAETGRHPPVATDKASNSAEEASIPDEASNQSGSFSAALDPATAERRISHERVGGGRHISAFEELLNKSRVYRRTGGNHSESSLIDDGRSTLALSISSSLTLGEVSRVAVYSLPVTSTEISNPECYQFGIFSTSPSTAALEQSLHSTRKSPPTTPEGQKRKLSAWWSQFKRSPPNKALQTAQKTYPVVFGVTLAESIRYANVAISLYDADGKMFTYGYIPIVLAKTGVYLKAKGAQVENIFSVNVSPKISQELRTDFDAPPRYGKGLDWTGYTCHDAATLLLRYILTLPEPVIPLDFYHAFREPFDKHAQDTTAEPDPKALFEIYQSLIKSLPSVNRQVLLYLIDVLAVFASNSDTNKMTLDRLAAIFQPGILSHPDHNHLPQECRRSQVILIFITDQEIQDGDLVTPRWDSRSTEP